MPTKAKGTYLLIMQAVRKESFQVGKLGLFGLEPKQYLYTGSAFGSGGLRSRLKHHLKITNKPHWHIDYLRKHVKIEKILYSTSPTGLEHTWATKLLDSELTSIPLKRFGASDCNCQSHLFAVALHVDLKDILKVLDEKETNDIKVFAPQPIS